MAGQGRSLQQPAVNPMVTEVMKEDCKEKPSGVKFTCRSWGSPQRELCVEVKEEMIQNEADQENEILE